MKHITPENLFDFAFVNTDALVKPLRGICVCFHGFTDGTLHEQSPRIARELGQKGIAWVFPYYSVWGWMGDSAMEFCEQVLDAAYQLLDAPPDLPFVSTGGSMGGMTALMYCVLGKRPVSACAADCPVTDIWKYYLHDMGARRAILSAHIGSEKPLSEIARERSPLYNADRLPNVPYFLLFGGEDAHMTGVHMPPMAEAMEARGLDLSLRVEPGMGHCQMEAFPGAFCAYRDFIVRACGAE